MLRYWDIALQTVVSDCKTHDLFGIACIELNVSLTDIASGLAIPLTSQNSSKQLAAAVSTSGCLLSCAVVMCHSVVS